MRGVLLSFAVAATAVACFSEPEEVGQGGTGAGCVAGELGCECSGGQCLGDLICDAEINRCFHRGCVPGAFECPCRDDDSCDPALVCQADVCVVEDAGTNGTAAVDSDATGLDATSDGDSTSGGRTETGSTDDATTGAADNRVRLFFGWSTDGDLGGAAGSDRANDIFDYVNAECDAQRIAQNISGCETAVAVISVSPDHTVDDVAASAPDGPLIGPGRVQIAASFAAALAGGRVSLDASLSAAGVYEDGKFNSQWWSGSDVEGGLDSALACAGWTANDGATSGRTGIGTANDSAWIHHAVTPACSTSRSILCACW